MVCAQDAAEKYGRGYQLLKRMGYVDGSGLGAAGRATPVAAVPYLADRAPLATQRG